MNRHLPLPVVIVVSALVGGAVICLALYIAIAKPYFETQNRNDYIAAISKARFASLQIELLRSGNISTVTTQLEVDLTSNLIAAKALEESQPKLREVQNQRDMYAIKKYISLHPLVSFDQETKKEINNFLTMSEKIKHP